MGYEYTVRLPGFSRQHLMLVVEKLVETRRYDLEGEADTMVNLRYSGAPRRETWPEDFAVALMEGGVLLTIHGGTKKEEKVLIRDLETSFQELGFVEASFEDV